MDWSNTLLKSMSAVTLHIDAQLRLKYDDREINMIAHSKMLIN